MRLCIVCHGKYARHVGEPAAPVNGHGLRELRCRPGQAQGDETSKRMDFCSVRAAKASKSFSEK